MTYSLIVKERNANNEGETMSNAPANIELLNKVNSYLVDQATANGVDLQTEFGTVDNWKKFVMSLTFKTLRELNVATDVAFDLVFGNGQYEDLVNSVWEAAQN